MPFPEDLPGPGIELMTLASAALSGGFLTTGPRGEPLTAVGHI